MCSLRNRSEVFERVEKMFVSSPRLEVPRFAGVLVAIVIPLMRVFLAVREIGWVRGWIEERTRVKISDKLALDMRNWASLRILLRAGYNVPDPNIQDNVMGKVDVQLMMCMASKEPVDGILEVETVMKETVVKCESVTAMGKIHM